jgi:hypothetical protein
MSDHQIHKSRFQSWYVVGLASSKGFRGRDQDQGVANAAVADLVPIPSVFTEQDTQRMGNYNS